MPRCFAVLVLVLLGLLIPSGCGRKAPAAADQTYTVRGVVEDLPGPKAALSVHHEAIPNFVGRDGRVTGMREMIMEFPDVAPKVSLDALRVGDPIEMTLEIRWNSDPRMLVTSLKKLPVDAKLNLTPPE
ncbi:hypothetical protein PHYC_01812 [Phycisphaerales bacterium]|nr:hypothetical protein PHYC_01812 [Phycisphaerales bacterium]